MNRKEFKMKADKINNSISNDAIKKYEKTIGQTVSKDVAGFLKMALEENSISKELNMHLTFDEDVIGDSGFYISDIIDVYESAFKSRGFRVTVDNNEIHMDEGCTINIQWDFEEVEMD